MYTAVPPVFLAIIMLYDHVIILYKNKQLERRNIFKVGSISFNNKNPKQYSLNNLKNEKLQIRHV